MVAYKVEPGGKVSDKQEFLEITDIYEDPNEDSYTKFSYIVNAIVNEVSRINKDRIENEKMKILTDKVKEKDEEFKSHADDNEGADIC